MTQRREFSPQTLSVLAALTDQPSQWQHGYALATTTGLKSGTRSASAPRMATPSMDPLAHHAGSTGGRTGI